MRTNLKRTKLAKNFAYQKTNSNVFLSTPKPMANNGNNHKKIEEYSHEELVQIVKALKKRRLVFVYGGKIHI